MRAHPCRVAHHPDVVLRIVGAVERPAPLRRAQDAGEAHPPFGLRRRTHRRILHCHWDKTTINEHDRVGLAVQQQRHDDRVARRACLGLREIMQLMLVHEAAGERNARVFQRRRVERRPGFRRGQGHRIGGHALGHRRHQIAFPFEPLDLPETEAQQNRQHRRGQQRRPEHGPENAVGHMSSRPSRAL